MLLCRDSRERPGGVDESEQRKPVSMCELHDADALPVPLGEGHAEVASSALVNVPTLLVADQDDALPPEATETADERRVVTEMPIAVKLDEIIEEPLHVVERVRPLLVTCEFDSTPDLVFAGIGVGVVDLPLKPSQLITNTDAA